MRTRQGFRSSLRNGHSRRTQLPFDPAALVARHQGDALEGLPLGGGSLRCPPEGSRSGLSRVADADGQQRELEVRLALEAGWLDRDNRPRIAVTRDREVRWTNPAARKFLRPPLPVYLQRNRLMFQDSQGAARFSAFFDALDDEPRRLPVTSGEGEGFMVLSGWSAEIGGERIATMDVSLPRPPLTVAQSGLAERFGLTRAESEIMDALVAAESPTAIARRQGVSIHTVRTHVRHIYAKLAVRSQTQLLRLALAYCGM